MTELIDKDFFRKAGRRGGLATKKKYGKEHFKKLRAKQKRKKI